MVKDVRRPQTPKERCAEEYRQFLVLEDRRFDRAPARHAKCAL
jgi:hypothetical protein